MNTKYNVTMASGRQYIVFTDISTWTAHPDLLQTPNGILLNWSQVESMDPIEEVTGE